MLHRIMREENITNLPHNESRQSQNYSPRHEDYEDDWSPRFVAKYDLPGMFMAFVIVLINSLVFILVTKRRSLRTPTNFFLIGLAASDLLNGFITLPLSITCNIFQEHGPCFASVYIWMFTSFLTLSHILAVTADRFIAIMCSLRYPLIMTKRRSYIALAFIWFSSLFVSLMQLWWLRPQSYDPQGEDQPEEQKKEKAFFTACVVLYLVMPLLFMAVAYLIILREVRRQIRREYQNIPAAAASIESEQRLWRQRNGKAAFIFLVMFFTHVACWLPFFLIKFQEIFNSFYLPVWTQYLFGYLRFASSILNPCLYIFGKHDFRKAWEMPCTLSQERNRAKSELVITMNSQV